MIQKIRVLNNISQNIVFKSYGLFNNMDLIPISSLPAWIINNVGFDFIHTAFLTIDPTISSITSGTYSYDFTLGLTSPPTVDSTLIVEVFDSFETLINECYDSRSVNLIWITREGGRESYTFNQRINYETRIGENKTFDNGGILKYTFRGKNFDSKTVYKTGVSNIEVDLIESLRTSIQAWEYNPITDISTPILVDPESFPKYNTKIKFNELSFKYRIGAYKQIQPQ